MDIKKVDRIALKSYFVKNAVPTAGNFADLIEGVINQKEDGIAKLAGEPLSVQADGDDTSQRKVINFYKNFADPEPAWTLSLNPRSKPAKPETAKPGWSISDAEGNSKFFIDQATGNVGIRTVSPSSTLDVNGFAETLGISVNNGQNTGVGRGIWLWKQSDSNHVIYSANPAGKSPANVTAVRGFFDDRHRLRLRTARSQGFLFENSSEQALVDIDSDNGNLWTKGAVYCGGSDIYFTQTDHIHTGIGNKAGYAAIENAKNYDALMILGRAKTNKERIVRLWDYLQVNGQLEVLSRQNVSTNNNAMKVQTKHGYMTCGALNASYFHMHTDRPKFYFSKPANAKGGFHTHSSRDYKKDIRYLSASDEDRILKSLAEIHMATFRYKDGELGDKTHIGLIAEEAPEAVVSEGGKSIDLYDYISYGMAALKGLQRRLGQMEARFQDVE